MSYITFIELEIKIAKENKVASELYTRNNASFTLTVSNKTQGTCTGTQPVYTYIQYDCTSRLKHSLSLGQE